MRIVDSAKLYAGGYGSGCNPAVGKCGRHPGDSHSHEAELHLMVKKKGFKLERGGEGRSQIYSKEIGFAKHFVEVKPSGHWEHWIEDSGKRPTSGIGPSDLEKHLKRSSKQVYAGGPGSGCNPEKGKCGRPLGKGSDRPGNVEKKMGAPGKGKGATYTMLKPGRARNSVKPNKNIDPKQLLKKRHELRGKFRKEHEVPAADNKSQWTAVYQAERPVSAKYDGKGRVVKRTGGEGEGTTVFVLRDFEKKRMTVHEMTTGKHRFLEYGKGKVFRFKNMGRGAAFLNKRYGIKQKLPRKAVGLAASMYERGWQKHQLPNFIRAISKLKHEEVGRLRASFDRPFELQSVSRKNGKALCRVTFEDRTEATVSL